MEYSHGIGGRGIKEVLTGPEGWTGRRAEAKMVKERQS
jgi:hypothetical protein